MFEFKLFINGNWESSGEKLTIRSPFDEEIVGETFKAGPAEIERAIQAAESGFKLMRTMPVFERAEKLQKVADGIRKNHEEFAQILSAEAGKPIKTARGEVSRAIFTFTDAAEETKRIRGEQLPLDLEPAAAGRWALVQRFPIGPILGISPFNFPLNLVCHKVAPALASGNSIILKPASQTPMSALRLAQEIDKAGFPAGALNVLPMDSGQAHLLVKDERLKMLTFTGSPLVGWALKNQCGRKKIALELGGNAGVIIDHDADIAFAAERCVLGAFSYAGQSCISVQRIYVHSSIHERFMDLFLKKVSALKCGDPADESTDIGPMIQPREAERVSQWISEAVSNGAKILTGGKREGNIFLPTVMTNVDPELKVSCQEVFAPLAVVYTFDKVEEAIKEVNNSDFGLQAGLFTNDAKAIFTAYKELEVGGVVIGDVPTWRIDHMPYGGTKLSGMGREGVRYAIEEMTEPKLLVMNL